MPRRIFIVENGNFHHSDEGTKRDAGIEASLLDVIHFLFSPDPPLVESGKAKQSKKERKALLRSRGV